MHIHRLSHLLAKMLIIGTTLTYSSCGNASDQKARGDTPVSPAPEKSNEPGDHATDQPAVAEDALTLLGVSYKAPAGYVPAQGEDTTAVFNKDDKLEIRIAYEFGLTSAGLASEAGRPLMLDEAQGIALQPEGRSETLPGGGLLQRYRGPVNGQTLFAAVAGLPRSAEQPGGVLIAGLTVSDEDQAAVTQTVKEVAASVDFKTMQQDAATLAYLAQGQWHHEDFNYSSGGVGSGSSSTHSYYCFANGRYSHSSQSHISVDVSGGSGYGDSSGGESGRLLAFGNGTEAWLVMINDANEQVSTLKIKLVPGSSAFKTGEKTFYELTGRSCSQ